MFGQTFSSVQPVFAEMLTRNHKSASWCEGNFFPNLLPPIKAESFHKPTSGIRNSIFSRVLSVR